MAVVQITGDRHPLFSEKRESDPVAEIAIAIEEEVQTTTTIATEEPVQTTKASVSSNESIHSDDVEATGNWLSSLRGASIGIIGILGACRSCWCSFHSGYYLWYCEAGQEVARRIEPPLHMFAKTPCLIF